MLDGSLTRISHRLSTAAVDPGMSTALRSLGLLDVLSSAPAGPSVALAGKRQMRLVSLPVCAASPGHLKPSRVSCSSQMNASRSARFNFHFRFVIIYNNDSFSRASP